MASVFTDDPEEQLGHLFERHLEVGLHHGAQFAVYADGELVVDLAGGRTGPDGVETTSDRKHVLFSCTKPYAGMAVHRLVEDGELDYDDRVVEHWPTFAETGTRKAEVTVRQVLSHHAGLPRAEIDAERHRWGDWDEIVAGMEAAELTYDPGTTPAYHGLTYGWLVGEIVRRVSGTPIEDVLDREVFGPLGLDDTELGTDEPESVATLSGFEPFDRCRDPGEGTDGTPEEAAAGFSDPAALEVVVPAGNGVGTARDMARFYGCLAQGGEIDGTRLVEPETIEELSTVHAESVDDGTLSRPQRYGLGFWVGGSAYDSFGSLSTSSTIGHLGLGSSAGWADLDAGIGFSYVTNGIREESYEHWARVNSLADAVRQIYG